MGYCIVREEDPYDLVKDEIDLSDYIKKRRFYLSNEIKDGSRKHMESINETSKPSDYKAIPKLKGIISKLDGHFCRIVFDEVLEKLEKRFRKEKYNDFLLVKAKFIDFFSRNQRNDSYSNLMLESEEFNEFLNRTRIFAHL